MTTLVTPIEYYPDNWQTAPDFDGRWYYTAGIYGAEVVILTIVTMQDPMGVLVVCVEDPDDNYLIPVEKYPGLWKRYQPENSYFSLFQKEADRGYSFDMPPSSNRYWRNFRGHMVISAEAKQYKQHVKQQMTGPDTHLYNGGGLLPGKLAVRAMFFLADNRRFDLDNRIKVLLDAMQGVAYKDDKQIFAIYAEKTMQPRMKKTPKPKEFVIVSLYDGERIAE